ncbi:MAG: hypothetical protein WC773_04520 [Patescibacteria group bacterium]|jgi:hypothetical protein
MPYELTKFGEDYKVTSPHGTKAKKTTKTKAKKQIRLLQAIEHNPSFTPYLESNSKYHPSRSRRGR